jgi:hypothetical protein
MEDTMLRHVFGKFLLGLAAGGVLTFGISFTDVGTAEAAQCKGRYITAKAQGGVRKSTISKAIGAWEYVVAQRYGKYWSDWDHASQRKTWCEGYTGYWTCWARAYPCYYKYSGGGSSGY